MNPIGRFKIWRGRRLELKRNRKEIDAILKRDKMIKKAKVFLTHADTNFDSTHLADNTKKVK